MPGSIIEAGSNILGGITGQAGAEASVEAAGIASAATQAGIAEAKRQHEAYMSRLNQAVAQGRIDIKRAQGLAAQSLESFQAKALGSLKGGYEEARGELAPYAKAGQWSLGKLQGLYDRPGSIAESPWYQFRMGEGTKALTSRLGALGIAGSGAAMKELTQFGQGLASEELDKAYGRLNPLASLGLSAAGSMAGLSAGQGAQEASLYSGTGSQLASLYSGGGQQLANLGLSGVALPLNLGSMYSLAGQQQAAGTMGAANAWAGSPLIQAGGLAGGVYAGNWLGRDNDDPGGWTGQSPM